MWAYALVILSTRISLENETSEGDSPVEEDKMIAGILKSTLYRILKGNMGVSTSNRKYKTSPIANSTVREHWKALLAES